MDTYNNQSEVNDTAAATPESVLVELPSVRTLLTNAWQSVQAYFPKLWFAAIVLFVLQLPALFIDKGVASAEVEAGLLSLMLVTGILGGLFMISFFHYIVQLYLSDTVPPFTPSLRFVWQYILPILGLMALGLGISVTGALLFIIPLIAFAVYNMFSYIVLIREVRRSPMDYIIRSTELVYGAFWALLGRIVAVFLIIYLPLSIAGGILGEVALLLLASLPSIVTEAIFLAVVMLVQVAAAIATVSVLLQLYDVRYSQTVNEPSQLPTKRLRTIYWTAAVLGWLGLFSGALGLMVILLSTLTLGI